MNKKIIKALKQSELYEYYKSKDANAENNEESIYLIDIIVLKDDIEYILSNKNEFKFEDDIDFIENIKKLKSFL